MFVLPDKDEFLKRSSRNLPDVLLKTVGNFNILDLLNSKFLILTKESIKKLEEKYIFDKETKKQRNKETKK